MTFAFHYSEIIKSVNNSIVHRGTDHYYRLMFSWFINEMVIVAIRCVANLKDSIIDRDHSRNCFVKYKNH